MQHEGEELEQEEAADEEQEKDDLIESTQDEIEAAFKSVVQPKALKNAKVFTTKKRKLSTKKTSKKDEENFIGYQAKDFHTEAGYSMLTGFEAEASKAVLDLAGDDNASLRKKKMLMRWDAKKKKYVKAETQDSSRSSSDKKKIKTESGVWIPASYKSDRYAKWRERSKLAQMQEAENEQLEEDPEPGKKNKKRSYGGLPAGHPAMKKAKMSVPKHKKGPKLELKRPEQILKDRKIKAKNENKQKGGKKKKKGGRGGGGHRK